ncbi:MAG: hypothetical protein ACN4GW_09840 [Desulforhopalus sp.]
MKQISHHKVLLTGDSYTHCVDLVHRYFDLTSLVIYDCIEAREEKSFSALDAVFFATIADAELHNRKLMAELIDELTAAGIKSTTDLKRVEQGYLSKTLHILSHFLDGFIGIDSYFYNLIDDCHWLPPETARTIRENPLQYWLIHIDCFAATAEEAGILHLRR